MIEIKPETENQLVCPQCRSGQPAINRIIMPSVHFMADCTCGKCGFDFYQTLPVGHSVNERTTICKTDGKLYPPDVRAN